MEQEAAASLLTMEALVDRVTRWGIAHVPNVLRIVLVLVVAFAVSKVLRHLVSRLERLADDGDPETLSDREKRARTLGRILRQAVAALVWSIGAMLVLAEVGVDLKPFLAGAGIAGLALGFGAQTLVKDLIAGFFILLENQFRVNDVIRTAGVEGMVDAMNLRTTVLRDPEGRVHVIPNGSIDVVTNLTREGSRALLDVGVGYREDIDRCLDVLRRVGQEIAKDPVHGPMLRGPFQVLGVERFDASAVVLRLWVETRPHHKVDVLREMRMRIKKAFDEAGIEMPFPQMTVHHRGEDRAGEASGAKRA
jgi:small conductance mechanosensitive channel